MRVRAFTVAALVLAAAGCKLFDSRELRFEPDGTITADGTLEFVVRGNAAEVDLDLGGSALGRHRVGEQVRVDVSTWKTAPYRLHARALTSGAPLEADTYVEVAHAPLTVEVTPPQGFFGSGDRFVATFVASVPLASATPGPVTAMNAIRGPTPTLVWAADRRSFRAEFPGPLLTWRGLSFDVVLRSQSGDELRTHVAWEAPSTWLSLTTDSPSGFVGPGVDLFVTPVPGHLPDPLELYDGGTVLTRFTGTPPLGTFTYHWDTTAVAEGEHRLSLGAPGWLPWNELKLWIDHTAPTVSLVTTGAPRHPRDCATITASEPLRGVVPSMRVDGAPFPSTATLFSTMWFEVCPANPIPFQSHVEISLGAEASDLAGNALTGGVAYDVSAWIPLRVDYWYAARSATLTARSAPWNALERYEVTTFWASAILQPLWAAREDSLGDSYLLASPRALGPPAGVTRVGGLAANGAFWRESGVVEAVVMAGAAGSNYYYAPEALEKGSDEPSVARYGPDEDAVLAYSRPDLAGGREIRLLSFHGARAASTPPHAAGAVASAPFVAAWDAGMLVAWVERPGAGGPAQVVAYAVDVPPTTWTPIPSIANADPLAPAETPALWTSDDWQLLTWVEAGRVWVRRWDGAAFGAAEPVSAEGAAARTPVVVRDDRGDPVVAFLQRTGERDRVRWARLQGTGWVTDAAPIDPDPGDVQVLLGGSGLVLGWLDGSGMLSLRAWNR